MNDPTKQVQMLKMCWSFATDLGISPSRGTTTNGTTTTTSPSQIPTSSDNGATNEQAANATDSNGVSSNDQDLSQDNAEDEFPCVVPPEKEVEGMAKVLQRLIAESEYSPCIASSCEVEKP